MSATIASLTKLESVIAGYSSLLTAYSGGVDSTVVAAVARRVLGREAAPAAIGDSASLPRHELDEARAIAAFLDVHLIEVQPGEQANADYQANRGDRCYFCKSHLYDALHALADARGIAHIANGTNIDDTGDHRPGLTAASENRIVSPLLDAGLNKSDVRAIAAHLHLPNADKPAAACLASRLAYGTTVTPKRLTMIEQAEDVLRELKFRGFRVRHHEAGAATIARIEVPIEQLPRLVEPDTRQTINAALDDLGYTYITIDLAGFRSGSGNIVLADAPTRQP